MNEPAQSLPPFANFDEFALWDAEQEEPYEYEDGHAVAMSGGSMRHSALAGRLQQKISAQLKPGCIVLTETMKIEAINSDSRYFYADGSVLCGAPEQTRDKALRNPNVLIEVMSRSSERRDRGKKWTSYQQLETLQDYILVSLHTQRIEHYARSGRKWLYDSQQDGHITLTSGIVLAIDDVYSGMMDLPAD
jgi:Uma2 family endonuclease